MTDRKDASHSPSTQSRLKSRSIGTWMLMETPSFTRRDR